MAWKKRLSALRYDAAWIGRAPRPCHEPRSKEGPGLELFLEESSLASLLPPAAFSLVHTHGRRSARVQPRRLDDVAAQIQFGRRSRRVYSEWGRVAVLHPTRV